MNPIFDSENKNDHCVLKIKNVIKKYKDFTAIDNVSLELTKGEIFGLLGPNGAGKTSLIECTEGIRKHDEGDIVVLGKNILDERKNILEQIGIQLQATGLIPNITLRETLQLYASFFSMSREIREILEILDLESHANTMVKNLSGGLLQRLSLGIALVNNAKLIFLDEPTSGLDPQSRRNLWNVILKEKENGVTIFLTTHYMEEAEQLCDRIAIMNKGKIIDIDSPHELIKKYITENTLEFSFEGIVDKNDLEKIPGLKNYWIKKDKVIVITDQIQDSTALLLSQSFQHFKINDLHVRRANLEDVFLKLTNGEL